MSSRILRQIRLGAQHLPTGKTRHTRGGASLPAPASLRIVQYDGDPGYYLLYLDPDGREMTDTYHETIERALEQAEWEFDVKPEDWTKTDN